MPRLTTKALLLTALLLQLVAQRVDAVEGRLLQLVYLHADGLFVLGSHTTEILHQGIDFTFLTEILEAQLLNVGCVFGI